MVVMSTFTDFMKHQISTRPGYELHEPSPKKLTTPLLIQHQKSKTFEKVPLAAGHTVLAQIEALPPHPTVFELGTATFRHFETVKYSVYHKKEVWGRSSPYNASSSTTRWTHPSLFPNDPNYQGAPKLREDEERHRLETLVSLIKISDTEDPVVLSMCKLVRSLMRVPVAGTDPTKIHYVI
jgi:hypothetical protein